MDQALAIFNGRNDILTLRCHDLDLAGHAIRGGSFRALRVSYFVIEMVCPRN